MHQGLAKADRKDNPARLLSGDLLDARFATMLRKTTSRQG